MSVLYEMDEFRLQGTGEYCERCGELSCEYTCFSPHRVICRECELSYILELAPQYMDAWLENEDSRKDFLLSWWDTLECPEQQEILWKAYKTERDRSKRRGEERESLKQAAELCSSSDGFVEFVKECLL